MTKPWAAAVARLLLGCGSDASATNHEGARGVRG
jgi:hypothetical protein